MLWNNPILQPNQGKFDSELDRALYELSLHGGAPDEQVGSSTEAPGTWAGIMRDGLDLARAIADDPEIRSGVTADDLAELASKSGVILYEDTQGFVSVDYFDTAASLEKHWQKVVDELSIDEEEY